MLCRRIAVVATVAMVALLSSGTAALATTGPSAYAVVHVTLRDGRIVLNRRLAKNVTFVDFIVKNVGKERHNFRIGGFSTHPLRHGQTQHLYVGFPIAGKYRYTTTLHATHAMTGLFRIVDPQMPD